LNLTLLSPMRQAQRSEPAKRGPEKRARPVQL
jgi:hypothetical protein